MRETRPDPKGFDPKGFGDLLNEMPDKTIRAWRSSILE